MTSSRRYDFTSIEDEFFNGSFSRITASLMKELLFDVYYKAQPNKEKLSDFDIAQELGLTPSQVRSLRYRYEQKQARCSDLSFQKIVLENPASCSPDGVWIYVYIHSLYDLEWLKNYLVNKGVYAESSISKETLKMPLQQYADIVLDECTHNEELEEDLKNYLIKFNEDNPKANLKFKDEDVLGSLRRILSSTTADSVLEGGANLCTIATFFTGFVSRLVS